MSSPAFLFPGQGSQYVGMGRAFFDSSAAVRGLFEQASDLVGKDLKRLCFEGPEATLVLTDNVQPAITLVSLSCLQVLRDEGFEPAAVAGHSVGEYAALYAAGVFSFADTMRLIQVRANAMRLEAERHPGAMVAVIGLTADVVAEILEAVGPGSLEVASYNTPSQIVLTGGTEAVETAAKVAKGRGARLIVPLKVSGAWHSRLMAGAQAPLRAALEQCSISPPHMPVIANINGEPHGTDLMGIRQALVGQIVQPVLWTQSMSALVARGHRMFVEVGPGRVLAGMLKDVSRDLKVMNVQDTDSLAKLRTAVAPPTI